MPNALGVPLCLQPTRSPSSLLSSTTSLSSEDSLGSKATTTALRTEKDARRQKKKRHQSGTSRASQACPDGIARGIKSVGRSLKPSQSFKKQPGGDEWQTTQEADESRWPVMVAVRCRPRKRQRAERHFTRSEEWRQLSDSSSCTSSGSSDAKSVGDRSSSGTVRRGIFEFVASREYVYPVDSGASLLPRRVHRPHRLFVQAQAHTAGSVSGRRSFDFDFILPPWKKQRDVYTECVEALINHVLQTHSQGRQQHATIVAYGQTGTGKTYTMGMLSDFSDDDEQGLIPRALAQILGFASARSAESGHEPMETIVTLSFLQIYLETIQDLLAQPSSSSESRRHRGVSSNDLPVRQSRDGTFYVSDLREYEISTIEDAHALLALAMRNRVLAATSKNKTSSRSHTLLTISLKQRRRDSYFDDRRVDDEEDESDEGEFGNDQVSTISFVDLAGSERVEGTLHFLHATRARQEQRIREAKFINRSLSALGGVIAALAQPKASQQRASLKEKFQFSTTNEREQHIRFRDSQLTKLLQSRLVGDRGRLLLIATVDDQAKNLSETLSTLKFASQCRRVELQRNSKLRGERPSSLRDRQDLLDQVLKDMKVMHESREAALRLEYQTRIEVLEKELIVARAEAHPQNHVLAAYTALCELVDDDQIQGISRPSVEAFRSQDDMMRYIDDLCSRLKQVFCRQQQPKKQLKEKNQPSPTADKLSFDTASEQEDADRKQLSVRQEPLSLPTSSISNISIQLNKRMILSEEHEAEFRAVAKHLITTGALDSIIVSSDDEDTK